MQKRPLIIAGAGVLKSGAMDELKELAEKAQIPVTNTLVGLVVSQVTMSLLLVWWVCMAL